MWLSLQYETKGPRLTMKLDKIWENVFQGLHKRQCKTMISRKRGIHEPSPKPTPLCLGTISRVGLSRLSPKESIVVLLCWGANTRVWGSWTSWYLQGRGPEKRELQNGGGDGLPWVPEALTEGWAVHTGKVRPPEAHQRVAALGSRVEQRYQRSSLLSGYWGYSLTTVQRLSEHLKNTPDI